MRPTILTFLATILLLGAPCLAAAAAPPDFARDVAPILTKYCAGCHNGADREGELSLESFADLQEGGEKGPIIVAGRADASLMIRALSGEVEPAMPPPDNPRPTDVEIDMLRKWIEAGAAGPSGAATSLPELATPSIAVAAGVRPYLTSMSLAPDGKRLALGSYQHVELVDPATKKMLATSGQFAGKVNSVSFSRDGSLFVASSGIAGLYGTAAICRAGDATTVSVIQGHRDAIYDAELSPDGKLLATCSYDRAVNVWDVAGGTLVRSLTGHNGAVYDLTFSPDGSLLATASADATVKIWKVAAGERLDTLGQPEGEQCAVAFSPDSNSIVAGGGDRQLRLWTLLSRDKPQINPLKFARTAHNSSIVKLAYSPDGEKLVTASEGRELVLWHATTLTPLKRYELQPDVTTGLAFEPSGTAFYAACINGSWQKYEIPESERDTTNNENDAASPAPSAADVEAAEPPPAEFTEHEPNNAPSDATAIAVNSVTSGVISAAAAGTSADADLYRFHANKGQQLVLEINAARSKSPLDSKLEVLNAAGEPVPRVVLQAVRTSYYTFRGHNSTDLNDFRMHAAADMEIDEYVYASGEVMKLWQLPQGPDSGFLVYPGVGQNRYTYFGTTAITHALNEPCYIVQPHQPGATIIPNGLPQYTLYYENDDDGWRKLGADSRVAFTSPADSVYLARVTDVRGMGGDAFTYKLSVRPARPNFEIKLRDKDLTINAGSGKEFTIAAIRKDDFDGEILVDISNLPPGFHVRSPLTIEAGQNVAYATITANADAPAPTEENAKLAKAIGSAVVKGRKVKKSAVKFGEIKLGGKPKILVRIIPQDAGRRAAEATAPPERKLTELFISPGETISATLKVDRNDFDGELKFGGALAGRNLPHGVHIDNIGLNGVTLLKGESERTIFITARKWVPECDRTFHLQAEAEGKQTSWPVMLHVRNRADAPQAPKQSVALSPETK